MSPTDFSRPVGSQRFNYCSAPMGDEQRLSPDALIALAREQFETATDFTVAVEEAAPSLAR